jgi:stage II sporulation protein D
MTLAQAGAKLGDLVQGSFRGIAVTARGRSPRIVSAQVVGTRGRTTVDGATIRARLGLYDTWASFTSIETRPASNARAAAAAARYMRGAAPEFRAARTLTQRLEGFVLPTRKGAAVTVQRREGRSWATVGAARTGAAGRYAFDADRPGSYRVRYRGDIGPAVTLR